MFRYTAQKMKFSITDFFGKCDVATSTVDVAKSTGNCGFGHIYWKNP